MKAARGPEDRAASVPRYGLSTLLRSSAFCSRQQGQKGSISDCRIAYRTCLLQEGVFSLLSTCA